MERAVELEKIRSIPMTISLGIIFNPKTKKVLIVKRKKPSHITGLIWCFPGTKINYGEDIEEELKEKIREKTGFVTESLGSIFAKTYSEENGLLSIYYLCEIASGKEKLSDEYETMKWISPDKVEEYFRVPLHPRLKEYLINLK